MFTKKAVMKINSIVIVAIVVLLIISVGAAVVLMDNGSGKSAPVADFTASPTTVKLGHPVQFTDRSANSPTNWTWDFDSDGKIDSYQQNPSYEYAAVGTYAAALTVSNDLGQDSTVLSITVRSPLPDIGFDVSASFGSDRLTVQFTDLSTDRYDEWAWDLDGDGTMDSHVQNPTWTYAIAGTYHPSLTVSNDWGPVTLSKNISVSPEQDWTTFHGDLQLTGEYGGAGPKNGQVLWNNDGLFQISGSSMVSANGMLYFISAVPVGEYSSDLYLNAVFAGNGTVLWTAYLYRDGSGSFSTPCYYDGIIYVPGSGARYASNGTLYWAEDAKLPVSCNGSPAVWGDLVYTSDWGGHHYYAYNRHNGSLVWSFDSIGSPQGTPAVVDGKVVLTSYVYHGGGYVFCLNAFTGDEIWTHTTEQDLCGSPAVAYGMVYVSAYSWSGKAELYAIDLQSGERAWTCEKEPVGIEMTNCAPVVAGGKVFVTGGTEGYSDGQTTTCLDAYTGAILWVAGDDETPIGSWSCSLIYADGVLYVGTDKYGQGFGNTFALNASNGEIMWHLSVGGSSPILVDGRLYTSGVGGIYCIYDPPAATGFAVTSDSSPDISAWDFGDDGGRNGLLTGAARRL